MWGRNRIGPHDKELLEFIIGSLLGDSHLDFIPSSSSARLQHKKGSTDVSRAYAEWVSKFLYDRGYSAHSKPNYTEKTGYASC
jgi:hypothetical protein